DGFADGKAMVKFGTRNQETFSILAGPRAIFNRLAMSAIYETPFCIEKTTLCMNSKGLFGNFYQFLKR
ncbi:MAG: hypothetical protein WKG03_20465, partial [Telluria sp.]